MCPQGHAGESITCSENESKLSLLHFIRELCMLNTAFPWNHDTKEVAWVFSSDIYALS